MDHPFTLLAMAAAMVLGLVGGWLLAMRPLADWRARLEEVQEALRERTDQLARMTGELATMSERAARADRLAGELDGARAERETLRARLAAFEQQVANFEEQKRLLVEAREGLLKEFQNTGHAVLTKAQEAFLARAEERFRQSEEKGEEKLKALLAPVGQKLESYERQVRELEEKRTNAFASLFTQIEAMRQGQEEVKREAARLGNALTNAPKARGRWGEQALRNLLEQCGLSPHTDFVTEQSVDTADGRLRPDAIVRIPGGKILVIDAKVSLNAYQEAFEAVEEDRRRLALARHVAAMKGHVQALATKAYQSQFSEAPDYVVMFVPGEHFVAAALEHDPGLWDYAFQNKVLLATPTNLVAIARTVAQVWRQDRMANEAREIGRMGAELYDRLRVAAEHLKRVGGGLETAVTNYNRFVGSFERNVLASGRRLADKGLEIGKEIDEVALVEGAPRYGVADLVAEPEDQAPEYMLAGRSR